MTSRVHSATAALNHAGAFIVLCTGLMICWEIISRNFLGISLPSVPELGGVALVLLTFLQLPHALASDKLLRVTYLRDRVPNALRRLLDAFAHTLAFVLFLALAITSWGPLLEAIETREFYGAQSFAVPTWPLRLAALLLWLVAAGCTLFRAVQVVAGDASRDIQSEER